MGTKLNYKQYKTLSELVAAVKKAGLASNSAEARKVIHEIVPKEKYFQGKIITYLKDLNQEKDVFFWKEQAGAGYQRNGLPDICAVIKGRFYGFEVKRPFVGKVSSIQESVIEKINNAGGNAYVVTSVDDVVEILKKDGVVSGKHNDS